MRLRTLFNLFLFLLLVCLLTILRLQQITLKSEKQPTVLAKENVSVSCIGREVNRCQSNQETFHELLVVHTFESEAACRKCQNDPTGLDCDPAALVGQLDACGRTASCIPGGSCVANTSDGAHCICKFTQNIPPCSVVQLDCLNKPYPGGGINTGRIAWNCEGPCAPPSTPTPTPTVTPTPTPTPTITPTPTVTPTPTPGPYESRCVSLSASPTQGEAPLAVVFNGSGYDSEGDIAEYEFDFGDGEKVTQTDSRVEHVYQQAGTYWASLRVKDTRGDWKNGSHQCKQEIKVERKPEVLAAEAPPVQPAAGANTAITLGLIFTGLVGAVLRILPILL